MKGFKVKLGENTYTMGIPGDAVLSMILNKRNDKFFMEAGGLQFPEEVCYKWLVTDLGVGDEIQIEIVDINEVSEPKEKYLYSKSPTRRMTALEKQQFDRERIERFYRLEKILTEEGIL